MTDHDEYSAEWLAALARLPDDPPALFEAWVDVHPLPKQRPRMNTRTGHAYTPADTARYEREVAWKLRAAMQGRTPFAGDIEVALDFQRKGIRRADIDNMSKAILDSANGVLYQDDHQIVSLSARVTYSSKKPGTRIRVRAA